jgi:hypothetical protein
VAKIGDWVVGTGSKNSPKGDLSGKVVYAMKITDKMEMSKYDEYVRKFLPWKIPDWRNEEYAKRVGDAIYDFSSKSPKLRTGVHKEKNRETDLGGLYALLSKHFYYFGDQPVPLPPSLMGIVRQGQGHRSRSNVAFVDQFIDWIENLGKPRNETIGKPQLILSASDESGECARIRRSCAIADEEITDQEE